MILQYSISLFHLVETLATDVRYKYVGCFVDQEEPNRELSAYSELLGNNNSPEKCVNACKEKGYVYAGLQYR